MRREHAGEDVNLARQKLSRNAPRAIPENLRMSLDLIKTALVGLVAGLLVTGCVVRPVVVKTPPPLPPPRAEVIVPQPSPAHVWIAGHWVWDGRAASYAWRPGHWAVPEAPTQRWVPGHWAARPGGYVWVEGHWRMR